MDSEAISRSGATLQRRKQMNTDKKDANIRSGDANVLSARGGSENESVLTKPTRRGLFQGTAAMAMAAALTPMVALTRPAAAQTDDLAGRDLLRDKRPVQHAGGTLCGAYDPHGDFAEERELVTEHLFLPWEDVDLDSLAFADTYARDRARKIMITIEPCSWALGWDVGETELRDLILSGQRDANMRAILNAVSGFQSPLIIRWAQEMEGTTGRFQWQNWAPADYIAAYRRMAEIRREVLPDAKLMWSPKGEPGLEDFYPGDDLVDLVGLSVFGLQEYDEIEHGAPRTFAESLRQGYELTVGFGKPIWVAELGYEGELPYVTSWANDATRGYAEFAELKEVNYFNDKEVHPWPHDLGLPDWRVVRNRPTYPVRRQGG